MDIVAVYPEYSLPYQLNTLSVDEERKALRIFKGDAGEMEWDIRYKRNIEKILQFCGEKRHHLVVGSAGATNHETGPAKLGLRRLLLAEAILALRLLIKGGMFMFRAFDTTTGFYCELFYLLHLCFEEMTIIKPNTSSPFETSW